MKEEQKRKESKLEAEDWKRKFLKGFLEQLIVRRTFHLFFRPKGIKFEEGLARVLTDSDAYGGFSIGDVCVLKDRQWYIDEGEKCVSISSDVQYRIVAFIELIGHPKSPIKIENRIKIEGKFCVLFKKKGLSYSIQALDDRPLSPILLFWVGGLEKVKE